MTTTDKKTKTKQNWNYIPHMNVNTLMSTNFEM